MNPSLTLPARKSAPLLTPGIRVALRLTVALIPLVAIAAPACGSSG